MTTETASADVDLLALAKGTDFVHVVIPGDPPTGLRPRTRLQLAMSGTRALAVAHQAKSVRSLFALFYAQMYMPKPVEVWKKRARFLIDEAKRARGYGAGPLLPGKEPLEVLVLVVTALPVSKHRKRNPPPRSWLTKRGGGDWDNYGKPVCDAAEGVLWEDDCVVARGTVETIQGRQGEEARVEFIARPLWDSPERTRFEVERDALL